MNHLLAHLSTIEDAIAHSGRILLGCDLDGTLAPIASTPDSAVIPTAAMRALERLTASGCVHVAIFSGRSVADLRDRIRLPIVLAGNHGLEIQGPDWKFRNEQAVKLRPSLDELCSSMRDVLAAFHGALLEHKHLTATIHYRLVAEDARAKLVRLVRHLAVGYVEQFSLRAGKMAVEIHPRLAWNKGSALALIRLRAGLEAVPCICFGDDRTDESMFQRFPDAISVRVGRASASAARFGLNDPDEVTTVLNYIADVSTDFTPRTRFASHVPAREAVWSSSG